MEKIETTPELAKDILSKGNRKIVDETGRTVTMINLNNQTIFSESKGSGSTRNIEDSKLLIVVPTKSKTVF